MKNLVKLSMLVVALATGSAFAQEHEITGGSNAGFNVGKGSVFVIDADVGYKNAITPEFQLGGAFNFKFDKEGAGKTTTFGFELGPTYNIGAIPEAIYVGVHGTFDWSKVSGATASTNNYGIRAFVGKRIALSSDITWNPELSYSMDFKAPKNWNFAVKIVNLAVHF